MLVRRGGYPEGAVVSLDHFDHASFRHIVDVFAVDRSGLRYFTPRFEEYGRDAIKGADPSTFVSLGDGWYRDARQAYYFDASYVQPELAVVKADMNTCRTLGGAYARDAKGLICEGVRKRDIADAEAVVGLGHLYARIGDNILYRGKKVAKLGQIDMSTARGLHNRLLMDANGHMLMDGRYRKPIRGLEVPSFRFLNQRYAVDAHRVYALGDDSLCICDIADRATIEPGPFDTVSDRDGRIYFSSGTSRRAT